MNVDRLNALRCAVEVLSGEGSGYTTEQKKAYKATLWNMLCEEESVSPEKPITDTPNPPERKPVTVVRKGE